MAKDASPWQKQALNKLDASSMETTRIREPQGSLVASSLRSERYSPGPLRLSNARSVLDSTSNLYIHLSMQERAHTNQSVEPTPATAHSGTYIHTNQSVDNIQQQLTLVHTNTNIKCMSHILYIHVYNIHTHTINPECGDTQQLPRVHTYSGVEILLATTHSDTHKPERG